MAVSTTTKTKLIADEPTSTTTTPLTKAPAPEAVPPAPPEDDPSLAKCKADEPAPAS